MELKDHKKEPMCSVKAPFVLSINKKNVAKHYDLIDGQLIDLGFQFEKMCDDTYWNHYVYNATKVSFSFEQMKRKVKKTFPKAEFQINTWYLEWLKGTSLTAPPHEENEAIFECFEWQVPFEKI